MIIMIIFQTHTHTKCLQRFAGCTEAYNPWRQEPTTSEPYPSPATSGGIYAIRKAQGCGLFGTLLGR